MFSIKKILPGKKRRKVGYRLYSYQDEKGDFDYDQYKDIQTKGNKDKINQSWVTEDEIVYLSKIIPKYTSNIKDGICHGTRRGYEQKWFANHLNAHVIGTEISDTAGDFENTIQWDFHEKNEEWLRKFDFVYSNSFDHSYDPKKALTNWMETLSDDGICIIEHTASHESDQSRALDPFGVDFEYFPCLVLEWSKNKFYVVGIEQYKHKHYFIIANAK